MRKLFATLLVAAALSLTATSATAGDAAPVPTCTTDAYPPVSLPCNPKPGDENCQPYITIYGVEALAANNRAIQAEADWATVLRYNNGLRNTIRHQHRLIKRLRAEIAHMASRPHQ